MMSNGGKKRGSAWRCISPILIYLVIMNLASFLVIFAYYMQQGFFGMVDSTMEELMDLAVSSALEDMDLLNFATMIVGDIILIPIFWRMHRKDLKQEQMDNERMKERKKNESRINWNNGNEYKTNWNSADEEKVSWNRGNEERENWNETDQTNVNWENRRKVPRILYGFLIIVGAASCLAASNMISMSGLIETSESYSSTVDILYSSGLVAELFVLGLLSPVMEELLFRGLVYRRFKEFTPVIASMIWASLVFALLHGNLVQGIYAFVVGFLLCYVYERYGSIAAPIIMHICSNLVSVIASETGILDFMYSSMGVFYGSTFVCCVIVIAMIYCIEVYVRPITEKIEQREKA